MLDGRCSFSMRSGIPGTEGWIAPEVLRDTPGNNPVGPWDQLITVVDLRTLELKTHDYRTLDHRTLDL